MGVSLYTSRVVLNTLGVNDFGIYNVVGGLVTAFTLVSGSLSSASQRFISFELGKKEKHNLRDVFSTTVTVHVLLAGIILVLAESVGIWFLNNHMKIDSARMYAANWVFQCSLFAFIISLISTPYNAAIIAYEKMKTFAYIGIGEVILKLILVLLLPFLLFDKLIVYSIFIMAIAIIVRILYGYYCKKRLSECVFVFTWNKGLFKSIAGFAGWNFIGVSSSVLASQGVSIILNIFCGVTVNAAQGIARQVQHAVTGFITNFMTALNPQITKSYASNNHEYMMSLVFQGARYSFYLMFLFSLPIIIETETILRLWLKIVPDYAVVFVQLTLILAISQTYSQTLITAMLATGKIKTYQIIVGGIQMLNFPLSYIALKFGFSPESTITIAIIISFACLAARLVLLKSMIKLPVKRYIVNVFLNTCIVTLLSIIIPFAAHYLMSSGLVRLFSVIILCILSTSFIIYFVGISKAERAFVNTKVQAMGVKYGIVR